MEDWLYDDGANAEHTVYEGKHKTMAKDLEAFQFRKTQDEERPAFVETSQKALKKIEDKVGEMAESKPWIPDEEK